MKSAIRVLAAVAALALVPSAWADSVTPTWEIVATGTFGGLIDGSPVGTKTENFTANLTLTFDSSGGILFPVYSGWAKFTGILGDFIGSWSDFIPSGADGGYLPTTDSYGDEVDFSVSYYDYVGVPGVFPNSGNPFITPSIGVPYLYDCFDPSICAAYGSRVGTGVFAGVGTVTQIARLVATPEPSSLALLAAGLLLIGLRLSAPKAGAMKCC